MRRFFIALAFSCAASAASAQPAPPQPAGSNALTDMLACSNISNDHDRLACFDAAAARVQTAQSSGDLVAVDRAQVHQIERDSFGFSLSSLANLLPHASGAHAEEQALEAVDVVVASINRRGDGVATFVTEDGQRWQQLDHDDTHNVRVGDTVHIRRASMGSFLLSSARGGAAHRVHRVN